MQWSVLLASLLLLLAAAPTRGQISGSDRPECKGVFDFYFVLDSSISIRDHFVPDLVPFVADVSSRYVDPNFRVSIITFSTPSHVILNLTRSEETAKIQGAIDFLSNDFVVEGSTFLEPGLINVRRQIDGLGGDTASVVLILTDGVVVDLAQAKAEAQRLRMNHGGRIFAIGIGSQIQSQQRQELAQITGLPRRVYQGNDFNYLPDIADLIIRDICIEITAVNPEKVCLGATFQITLSGSGFLNNLGPAGPMCRFTVGGESFTTVPTEAVTNDTVVCPAPTFTSTGLVLLELSLDSISYISSSVTMEIDDCKTIVDATPTIYCRGERPDIVLLGSGFVANLNLPEARCRFTRSNGEQLFTEPLSSITDTRIVCPSPNTGTFSGRLSLQVTTTGQFYIEDVLAITVEDCTGVSDVFPNNWCFGEVVNNVTIQGSGFTEDLVSGRASCEFQISSGEQFIEVPLLIEESRIVCPTPNINYTGYMGLRITTNGELYIGGTRTLIIDDCTERDYSFVAGIVLGLLALILLLALCLLWCYVPLITGKIIGGLPPEPKEPTPLPTPLPTPPPPPPEPLPPTPGRKWEVVDASYYGGRGAGGMRPMKVSWGGKGATELGNKLTKAKDANVIEVVEEEGLPGTEVPPPIAPTPAAVAVVIPPDKEPGCWDKIKKKLRRWYAVASSYRPVFTNHGTLGKKILWFPGPDGIEKARHEATPSSMENGHGAPSSLPLKAPPPPKPYSSTRRLPPPRPIGDRHAPPVPTASREQLLAD